MSIYEDDPNVFVKISRNAIFTNRMHHMVKFDPLNITKVRKIGNFDSQDESKD